MARSLEGKWFHTCYNNGVEAVVSFEILRNLTKKKLIIARLSAVGTVSGGLPQDEDPTPHIIDVPIFTFVNRDRFRESPWFTGTCSTRQDPNVSDLRLLLNYITRNGGQFGSALFYVPFSNGDEVGVYGRQAQLQELRYVTTDTQFEETFGVSLQELRDSGTKYL